MITNSDIALQAGKAYHFFFASDSDAASGDAEDTTSCVINDIYEQIDSSVVEVL